MFEINEDDYEDEEEVILEDLNDILDTAEDSEISLPPHHRCASHTLNRVAVSDCEGILTSHKTFKMVMNKCKNLWRLQNKVNTTAEQIHELLGVYLIKPNLTRYPSSDFITFNQLLNYFFYIMIMIFELFRWNSTFDAVQQILTLMLKENVGLNKINECCDFAGTKRFTRDDLAVLQEYVNVMKPLAVSLDLIQGEKEMYLGYLLPVINTLLNSTQKLREDGLEHFDLLAERIITGVKDR